MITFKITPERFAEAITVFEYLSVCSGDLETIVRVAPLFVVDKTGKYVVEVELDDEGDIKSYKYKREAMLLISKITAKRMRDELASQFKDAALAVVNPTKAEGSHKRSKPEREEPPAG